MPPRSTWAAPRPTSARGRVRADPLPVLHDLRRECTTGLTTRAALREASAWMLSTEDAKREKERLETLVKELERFEREIQEQYHGDPPFPLWAAWASLPHDLMQARLDLLALEADLASR